MAQVSGGFSFEGLDRTYKVYVPSYYTPDDHFPLLLALHGLTQTGNTMMQFSDFNTYAEQDSFLVVYPDGIDFTWNVGFSGGSTTNDVGFLSALIDTLHEQYNIDYNRVYSTGFSNGGFMSYRLACELSNRIAAIASVAGTMTNEAYSSCQPARNVPVMHIHGTNDLVVAYNGGFGNKSVDEVLSLWRGFNNCPASPLVVNLPDITPEGSTVQTSTWSPCDDSTEVMLYKIINGGHSWPGSIGTTGLGNTNRDIIASQEIWNFVSRFSLGLNTGLNEHTNGIEFHISPNPAINGSIRIDYSALCTPAAIELYATDGTKICSQSAAAGTTSCIIQTNNFLSGLYLLRMRSATSQAVSKLVIR